MLREDLIAEISMRRDIPMEDVEEVLEEEDFIFCEEALTKKKKRRICMLGAIVLFVAGAVAALAILRKKQAIDFEKMLKSVKETVKNTVKSTIKRTEE